MWAAPLAQCVAFFPPSHGRMPDCPIVSLGYLDSHVPETVFRFKVKHAHVCVRIVFAAK